MRVCAWTTAAGIAVLASSMASAQAAVPVPDAAKQQARIDLVRQIRLAGGDPDRALQQLDRVDRGENDPDQGPDLRQTLDNGISAMTVLRAAARHRR